MRFGVREICDVVLRAKAKQTLGSRTFYKNEPVLYFDTLKTSSLEGASTTVYAQGGRGNPRLIAWEGERTLTFTMEDALLSAESFAILSGAGLIAATDSKPIYVHTTDQVQATGDNTFTVKGLACWNGGRSGKVDFKNDPYYHGEADIFCMKLDDNGEIASEPCVPASIAHNDDGTTTIVCQANHGVAKDDIVFVDYYVQRKGKAQVIEITADKFGGNYYLEASTLFRRESDGVDMPAEFVIPNCKVQSNFTFTMASSGDPSTFTFTIDAFPDYTKFDKTHKVLAAIQVIEDEDEDSEEWRDNCTSDNAIYPDNDRHPEVTAANATDVKIKDSVIGVTHNVSLTGRNVETTAPDETLYGSYSKQAVELHIDPDLGTYPNEDGSHTKAKIFVVQTNPALADFSSDPTISQENEVWTKKKGYDWDKDGAYSLLVTKEGPIKVTFYAGTEADENKVLATYNISITGLTFKA